MVLTRAAQLVPQQEPGWGRIRPLAREPAGGNKMFPAGRVGWEEPVLGQDLQPGLSHRHLSGAGSDPAPGVLGCPGLWMGFSCHAEAKVSWGPRSLSFPHGAVTQEHPPSPGGSSGARSLGAGGSSFPGLCSACLWGFSLLPVLRQLSSLLREE